MKMFQNLTNRLLLAGLFLGTGLAARAQTITLNGSIADATAAQVGGGGQGYACMPYLPANPTSSGATFVFTPGTFNERVESWNLLGEGTALTGFTGTDFKFYPSGFGKARVTVSYSYDTKAVATVYCPDGKTPALCGGQPFTTPIRAYATRTYDFFKSFTPAQGGYGISGPTCLPSSNLSVVYSINSPIVSTLAQAAANIGTDTYKWFVTYTSGPAGVINTAITPSNTTTDGTTITIPQSAFLLGNFSVEVRAGKCNVGVAGTSIAVVVTPDLNAAFGTTFPPACLPVGATTSSFSFTTVANTTYSLGTTVGLLSAPGATTPAANISFAGTGSLVTVTLSNIPTAGTGAITIVGVGGSGVCFGTQTVIKQVNRQLVLAQNLITPTCVSSGVPVVLTMANVPAGATWSVPAGSGWSIVTNANGTATVTPGAVGTSVLVSVTTACGSLTQTIRAAGAVAGCDYEIKNLNSLSPHQYGAGPVLGSTTCPTTGNQYTFTLINPLLTGAAAILQTSPTSSLNNFPFTVGPPAWPNYTVQVRVTNNTPGNCLDITRTAINQVSRPAAGPATGSTTAPAARAALDEVLVYPNPSTDVVNITLPESAKGVAHVSFVDVLGRVQRELTTTDRWTAVPVTKLPAGTYTVRVVLADGTRTARPVVVSH